MSHDVIEYTGNVLVKDGTKGPVDFSPNREVSVQIFFSAGSSTDMEAAVDRAADKANSKVNQLLGRDTAATLRGASAAETTGERREGQTPGEPEKPARKPRTPKDAGATPSPSVAQPSTSDPLADLGDLEAATLAQSGESLGADPLDGFDEFDVPPATSVVVTDDALNAAVQKRNGELKDAVKIRGLIGTFNPDVTKAFQLRQIPQDQRASFLAQLVALV